MSHEHDHTPFKTHVDADGYQPRTPDEILMPGEEPSSRGDYRRSGSGAWTSGAASGGRFSTPFGDVRTFTFTRRRRGWLGTALLLLGLVIGLVITAAVFAAFVAMSIVSVAVNLVSATISAVLGGGRRSNVPTHRGL